MLVAVGLVLLSVGLFFGTRPVVVSELVAARESPHALVRRESDCGSVFAPNCDLMRVAARRAMVSLLLTVGGIAMLAAGLTVVLTQRRGDAWTQAEALGYVAAPTLILGFVTLGVYAIYVAVAFPRGN